MYKDTTTNAYLGAFAAFISGLNVSEWAAIFGILFGLATLVINWYYKHRDYKLKEQQFKRYQQPQTKDKQG